MAVLDAQNPLRPKEDPGDRDAFTAAARQMARCTQQHLKLLYLISLHTRPARTKKQKEKWLRENSLHSLVYEAILDGTLLYDYSPTVMTAGEHRTWANVSQGAVNDLQDLVQAKLVRMARLTTDLLRPSNAVIVTLLGQKVVKALPALIIKAVDAFAYHTEHLVKARWDSVALNSGTEEEEDDDDDEDEDEDEGEGKSASMRTQKAVDRTTVWSTGSLKPLALQEPAQVQMHSIVYTDSGWLCRKSCITDMEEVSYVSSPFLPALILGREPRRVLSDNSHRASECVDGRCTRRAEDLAQALTLGNVHIMVCEWIPFGANHIASLYDRLGCGERVAGGQLYGEVDLKGMGSREALETGTGLTRVEVLDAHPVTHVNLEACITLPEEDGVVQVESFGIHFNKNGGAMYGLRVDAIGDRLGDSADGPQLAADDLARLLVDVLQDSSSITQPLLSQLQRDMLHEAHPSNSTTSNSTSAPREKFTCIIARDFEPRLEAHKYMDGGEMQTELRQMLGTVMWACDLSPDDVCIMGTHGMLLRGPRIERHEDYVCMVAQLQALELFVRQIFSRCQDVSQRLLALGRRMGQGAEVRVGQGIRHPDALGEVRNQLSVIARTVALLEATIEYLHDAVADVAAKGLPLSMDLLGAPPTDICGKEMLKRFKWREMTHNLAQRVEELRQHVAQFRASVFCLRKSAEGIKTREVQRLCGRIATNTKQLGHSSREDTSSQMALAVMQLVLGATLSWELLDVLLPYTKEVNFDRAAGAPAWLADTGQWLIAHPYRWGFLSVWATCVMTLVLMRVLHEFRNQSAGFLSMRVVLNVKISDMGALATFLSHKHIEEKSLTADGECKCPPGTPPEKCSCPPRTLDVRWQEEEPENGTASTWRVRMRRDGMSASCCHGLRARRTRKLQRAHSRSFADADATPDSAAPRGKGSEDKSKGKGKSGKQGRGKSKSKSRDRDAPAAKQGGRSKSRSKKVKDSGKKGHASKASKVVSDMHTVQVAKQNFLAAGWGGTPPHIEVCIDQQRALLRSVVFVVDVHGKSFVEQQDIQRRLTVLFLAKLAQAKVLEEENEGLGLVLPAQVKQNTMRVDRGSFKRTKLATPDGAPQKRPISRSRV